MDHTKRYPRTLAGFGLTWHGGSRFSCFLEILETHFITKYLQIGPRASRLVLGFFWGVAHTIFVGSGAHEMFWVWRTRYLFGSGGGGHPTPPHSTRPKTNNISHIGFGGVLTIQKCADKWCATFCPPYRGIWARKIVANSISMIFGILGKVTLSQNGLRSFLSVPVLENTSFYF